MNSEWVIKGNQQKLKETDSIVGANF